MVTADIKKIKKVSLEDYDSQFDIESRLCIKGLSKNALEFLEELLYQPLKVSLEELRSCLGFNEQTFDQTLQSLFPLNFFFVQNNFLYVDKEKRKYFEIQLERFDEDFRPHVGFHQTLFKLQSLDTLLKWYHIPKTATSIFQALIDKYLLTPAQYERHCREFFYEAGLCHVYEFFENNHFDIKTRDLETFLNLDEYSFEKLLLEMEWNVIGSTYFTLQGSVYEQRFSFFSEFLTYRAKIANHALTPLTMNIDTSFQYIQQLLEVFDQISKESASENTSIIERLRLFGFIREEHGYRPTMIGEDWMNLSLQQKAHIIFKHPKNLFLLETYWPNYAKETTLIALQNDLSRLLENAWYDIDEYIQKSTTPLTDEQAIYLQKSRGYYHYPLPQYTDEEKKFLKYFLTTWLFESGVIDVYHFNSKTYIKLSPLGVALFH